MPEPEVVLGTANGWHMETGGVVQDSLSPSENTSGGSSGASKVQLHFFLFAGEPEIK